MLSRKRTRSLPAVSAETLERNAFVAKQQKIDKALLEIDVELKSVRESAADNGLNRKTLTK